MKPIIILIISAFVLNLNLVGQEKRKLEDIEQKSEEEITDAPAFKMFRAEEDYSYLKNSEENKYEKSPLDKLKLIPFNESKSINLLFGGEFRPRVEHFNNRNWTEEDETFYTQRLSLHSKLNLGESVNLFSELYHGMVSLEEEEFAQSDQIDFHQMFVNVVLFKNDKVKLYSRTGRQEFAIGSARLLGLREGPNIRRAYDMQRIGFHSGNNEMQLFYGKEVIPLFKTFDNEFSLFERNNDNVEMWGMLTKFSFKNDPAKNELYYIGFNAKRSFFNDAKGEDHRHTIGLRRFGAIKKRLRFNTELIGQIGKTNGKDAIAWAFETDWHYLVATEGVKPEIGLKVDVMSGDNDIDDDRIQSFNPMFTNPAYFSLAGTIAPVNLIEFHPSVSIKPKETVKIYLEWSTFLRFSINDGVYKPPRFLARNGRGSNSRYIGNQLGLKLEYEFSRHVSCDVDFSYFLAGTFLKETGEAENILHVAPTVSFKF